MKDQETSVLRFTCGVLALMFLIVGGLIAVALSDPQLREPERVHMWMAVGICGLLVFFLSGIALTPER